MRDSKGHFMKGPLIKQVKVEDLDKPKKKSKPKPKDCNACHGTGLKGGVVDAVALCSKCDGAGIV